MRAGEHVCLQASSVTKGNSLVYPKVITSRPFNTLTPVQVADTKGNSLVYPKVITSSPFNTLAPSMLATHPAQGARAGLSLIHISEPTRPY